MLMCGYFGGSNHGALDLRNSAPPVLSGGLWPQQGQPRASMGGISTGPGVSSDSQPMIDPIDTHRLLFYYLHEKQSSVPKFKAMVSVCSLT